MQRHKIVNLASDVKDGDILEVKYSRSVAMMKKTWTGREVKKVSVTRIMFDSRTWDRALMEINGINNPLALRQDQGYRKVNGCLFWKEGSEEQYLRFLASTKESIETLSVKYYSGKKEVTYKELEEYMTAKEKIGSRDKVNDIQTSTGNAGHEPIDRIYPTNYKLDNIVSFKVIG